MNFARQTAALSVRHLKTMMRQPAFVFITLTQPVIWLLLFGALFRKVTDIPGFGSHNYIGFLTPGVVIMTALFSSGWTGMTFIEDMESGVMDRFLTSPVSRGALVAASLSAQVLATIIQSLVIVGLGWATGASYPGGATGVVVLVVVAVLIAVSVGALSNALALMARQRETLIAASSSLVLPLTFLSSAFLAENLVTPWIRDIARRNPVDWAIKAGRDVVGAHVHWATVGSYLGMLVATAVVCGWLATRAFGAFQRAS
jgi:ABC-2 type transport system permease protein